MKLINYKNLQSDDFPPKTKELTAKEMLEEIVKEDPKYAFVISWDKNNSIPVCHTSFFDAAVLSYRLQDFLNALYAGKYDNNIKTFEQ